MLRGVNTFGTVVPFGTQFQLYCIGQGCTTYFHLGHRSRSFSKNWLFISKDCFVKWRLRNQSSLQTNTLLYINVYQVHWESEVDLIKALTVELGDRALIKDWWIFPNVSHTQTHTHALTTHSLTHSLSLQHTHTCLVSEVGVYNDCDEWDCLTDTGGRRGGGQHKSVLGQHKLNITLDWILINQSQSTHFHPSVARDICWLPWQPSKHRCWGGSGIDEER